jgi:hypothetical protein
MYPMAARQSSLRINQKAIVTAGLIWAPLSLFMQPPDAVGAESAVLELLLDPRVVWPANRNPVDARCPGRVRATTDRESAPNLFRLFPHQFVTMSGPAPFVKTVAAMVGSVALSRKPCCAPVDVPK